LGLDVFEAVLESSDEAEDSLNALSVNPSEMSLAE
jgi:hypothetical protein